MALDTYGGLKDAVLDSLNKDDADTAARLPNFIRYAADEICRALRTPAVQKTTALTITGLLTPLPADFRAVVSLTLDGDFGRPLRAVSPSERAELTFERYDLADLSGVGPGPVELDWADGWTGRPTAFAIEGANLAVAPGPGGGAYQATLLYDAAPAAFADDTDTNPLLQRAPTLYLHGALSAGFRFWKDSAWQGYEALFHSMLEAERRRQVADAMSGPLRPRPATGYCP